MADEFASSVDYGLTLAKRIYYGKNQSVLAPKPVAMSKSMSMSRDVYLPTAPMVYAVIAEPSIVDNPDIPSYQPYVYGRCDPPALIPLEMHGIAMEVDCYMDTAFVTVCGTWRVHCVMSSGRCDCRIAIPMGEEGSVLGVEVDVMTRSYYSQLVTMEDTNDREKVTKAKDGCFLKCQIYTLKVPQVEGGSSLTIKVSWSQKLLYHDGQFCLSVPFSFPAYVIPAGKDIYKREKIRLNVNCGTGIEVLCKTTSHPVKVCYCNKFNFNSGYKVSGMVFMTFQEIGRWVGKLGFLYEAQVQTWSNADFNFSYAISSSDIFGGLLLQSPPLHDFDQREMFCFYLYPGNSERRKVFKKEVVFVVDISGSMRGGPLEDAKNVLLSALSELNPQDSFNIIAFNGDTHLLSSSMELVTKEAIENASQWIDINFIAEGGTNILFPLNQAIEMLAKSTDSIPLIFLITDGSVEDERHICNVMKGHLTNAESICPRICTFGIGSYCNHYFLKMLSQIGRGHFDASYDADSIVFRMQRLFAAASSVILANITIETLEDLDSLELYPFPIPDLSFEKPVIVSGRYHGNFPNSLKASGILADMSNFTTELKVQEAKEVPLEKVFARRQIDILTTHAWLSESKQLEEKVAKMSIQTRVPSEYTRMILLQIDKGKQASESVVTLEVYNKSDVPKMVDLNSHKIIFLRSLGIGFGNLIATAENVRHGPAKSKLSEPADIILKAASNCCSTLLDRFCCMCFIRCCSKMSDQCSIALTQLCTGLACFGCLNCCFDLCMSCD
ncbi:hypothetical protein L1049_004292 [Liquidambar formosana]|uniref:VWFA domain-containing protein n=1 Tax=Liquidambar formosana TaxID=63359 RepID=A0AAP0WW07_LIQFO